MFSIFTNIIGLGIFLLVSFIILTNNPQPLGFLFIAYVGYLIAPIKHPCDYSSYSSWWTDRKNWFRR